MFDTRIVGKKIAALRKERNKTQMELADEMGVSYQAVSNWERGNSMPDISKLPQLALILGASVDEILGESKETELLEHVINGTEQTFLKEQKTEIGTIAEIAPLMKPEQTKTLVENVVESAQTKEGRSEQDSHSASGTREVSIKDLTALAPYLEEAYLEELVERYGLQGDLHSLAALAPFLSEEILEKAAIEFDGNLKDLTVLAPFLSEEALGKIVRKTDVDLKEVTPLAPFLSKQVLREIVMDALEKGKIKKCVGLYPFLDDQTLREIADCLMKEQEMKALQSILPFL